MKIELSEKHVYKVDGKRKANVTTILKIIYKWGLERWKIRITIEYLSMRVFEIFKAIGGLKKKELIKVITDLIVELKNPDEVYKNAVEYADSIAKEAADIGTKVHEAIGSFFRNETFDITTLPQPAQIAFNAFLDWIGEHDFKCEATEIKIYHPTFDYCGTADAIGMMDGEPVLLDWKTGSGIYPEASLQVAAYIKAYKPIGKMPNVEIAKAYIIRFPKEGGFDPERDVKILERCQIEAAFETFLAARTLYLWNLAAKRKGA